MFLERRPPIVQYFYVSPDNQYNHIRTVCSDFMQYLPGDPEDSGSDNTEKMLFHFPSTTVYINIHYDDLILDEFTLWLTAEGISYRDPDAPPPPPA